MKKRILLICMAFLSLMGVRSQVPTTSTTGNDVWYYIKAPFGSTTTAVWATAQSSAGLILNEDLIFSQAQLWKVVANGSGLALQNKAYGTFLNCDLSDYEALSLTASLPTTPLQFTASTFIINAVHVENFGVGDPTTFLLCAGHADYSWGWANYYDESHLFDTSFSFVLAETAGLEKDALMAQINKATDLSVNSPIGDLIGQYTQQAKTNLLAAIASAQTVYNKTTASNEESKTAIDNIVSAIAVFNASAIQPTSSTSQAPVWYLIKSASKPEYSLSGKYLTSNENNNEIHILVADNTDYQLWRFEKQSNGNYYVFNKGKNLFLDNIDCNSNTGVELVLTNKGDGSYAINKIGTQLLHAQENSALLVNWADGELYQSRWAIQLAASTQTGLNATKSEITVTVIDKRIVVTGTEDVVRVFTISGISIDGSKVLDAGVYIVRVADKTVKMNIN